MFQRLLLLPALQGYELPAVLSSYSEESPRGAPRALTGVLSVSTGQVTP